MDFFALLDTRAAPAAMGAMGGIVGACVAWGLARIDRKDRDHRDDRLRQEQNDRDDAKEHAQRWVDRRIDIYADVLTKAERTSGRLSSLIRGFDEIEAKDPFARRDAYMKYRANYDDASAEFSDAIQALRVVGFPEPWKTARELMVTWGLASAILPKTTESSNEEFLFALEKAHAGIDCHKIKVAADLYLRQVREHCIAGLGLPPELGGEDERADHSEVAKMLSDIVKTGGFPASDT